MLNSKDPLYIQIINYLKEQIFSGKFPPESQLPTEMELAEQFGVSRITSKRAMEELEREGLINRKKGSGSFVSSLQTQSSYNNPTDEQRIISVVIPFDSSKGRIIDTIKGSNDFLKSKDYFLTIHNTGGDPVEEGRLLHSLIKKGVNGIIYYPFSDRHNLAFLNNLYLDGYPLVTIDKNIESIPFDYVISDNFKGGYEITSYLIKTGHRKIAYVSDVSLEVASSVRNRYFGYCKALNDNSIPINEDIALLDYTRNIAINSGTGFNQFDGEDQEVAILKKEVERFIKLGVTAIEAVNDIVAIYLGKACQELGVKVPEDISIVGFDNIEISGHIEVPVTTVEQDFYQIGWKAAEIITKRIENVEDKHCAVTLPVKIIERQSCKPITNQAL